MVCFETPESPKPIHGAGEIVKLLAKVSRRSFGSLEGNGLRVM